MITRELETTSIIKFAHGICLLLSGEYWFVLISAFIVLSLFYPLKAFVININQLYEHTGYPQIPF